MSTVKIEDNKFLLSNEIEEINEKLQNHLIKKGINTSKLDLKLSGSNYLLYECGDINIEIIIMKNGNCSKVSDYIKTSDSILKPIDEELLKFPSFNLKILYFSKLFFDNITDNDVIETYCNLRNDGYLWENAEKNDLVRDSNGKCVLINYDKITYVNDMLVNMCKSAIEEHAKNNPKLNKIYMKKKKAENNKSNKILSKIMTFLNK